MIEYAKNKLRLQGLQVIESDVLNISGRISDYDPMLITTYNPKKKEFQIYDAYRFPKVQVATFADELTPALIEKVRKANNSTSYTFLDKSDDIDQEEYKKDFVQAQKRKQFDLMVANEVRNADKQTTHFVQRGV